MAAKIDLIPTMHEGSSAVQIQCWRGDVQNQTAAQNAMQTHSVIQI